MYITRHETGIKFSDTSNNCFLECVFRDLKVVIINKCRMMQVRWRNNTNHLCHNKGLEISAPEDVLKQPELVKKELLLRDSKEQTQKHNFVTDLKKVNLNLSDNSKGNHITVKILWRPEVQVD